MFDQGTYMAGAAPQPAPQQAAPGGGGSTPGGSSTSGASAEVPPAAAHGPQPGDHAADAGPPGGPPRDDGGLPGGDLPGGASRPPGPDRPPSAAPSSSAGTSEIRSLLRRRAKEWDRPKSSIGSVKIEEFSGDRRRYLKWRRAIEAQEQLYRLEAAELTMLVYLSTRGEARDVLDQVPLSDLTAPGGNVLLWKLLDESFGESCAELFERAERELNTYRRVSGQPIATYLANMRRLRAQYVRVDPDTTISDRAWAQRLLNRASLSKRERLDVYYSAGGAYTTTGIESALRHRCAQTHEEERRVPTPAAPSSRSSWSSRPSSTRSPSTSASSVASSRRPPFGRGPPKRHGVHLAEELEDVDEEDLDAEEGEEIGPSMPEHEPEDVDMNDEEPAEDDDVLEAPSGEEATAEEVCEAFAAGWKAKAKTAGTRKARGWTQGGPRATSSPSSRPPSSSTTRSLADKKKIFLRTGGGTLSALMCSLAGTHHIASRTSRTRRA